MTPIDVSERCDFAIASRCRGHVAEETEDALKAVSVENAASRACAPRAVLRRPPTQIKSSSRFLDHADCAWQSYISVKYTVSYDHSVLKRRRQEMYAFTPARRRASPRSLTRCELWKKRRAPAADALAPRPEARRARTQNVVLRSLTPRSRTPLHTSNALGMSSLSSVAPVVTRASARAQNSADRIAERRAVAARPGRASGPQVAPRLTPRRGADVVPRARKGMLADTLDGDGKKKKKDKKAKKAAKTAGSGTGGSDSIAGSLEPAFAGSKPSTRPSGKNWIEVGNVTADFKTKPIKPLVLANGNFILVKWEDLVFCADCNSTAYQYPLIDGELFFGAGGPAIRSPLDGTEYDLTTGAVITWCPKNNPIRKALGTLKAAAEPVPLPVYPTRMEADGSVLTNFVDKIETKTGFSNDAAGSMQGGKGVEIAVKAEDGSGADDAAPATSPASPAPPAPPAEENAVSPAILVGIGLVALATVYLQVSSGGDVPAPPQ